MKSLIKRVAISTVLTAILLGFSSALLAYEKNDFIVRAGVISLQPDEEAFGTLGTINTGLGKDEQLGVTFSYMLSEQFALGVLLATPFKHEVTSNGARIGETKLLPPGFFVEYFPLNSGSKLQPYIGVGFNYTTFFSEESTLGSLNFDDSFGLAVEAGVDYHLGDNLLLNATIWRVDVDTDATLNGADVGGVNIDPWGYMLSIGYVF